MLKFEIPILLKVNLFPYISYYLYYNYLLTLFTTFISQVFPIVSNTNVLNNIRVIKYHLRFINLKNVFPKFLPVTHLDTLYILYFNVPIQFNLMIYFYDH